MGAVGRRLGQDIMYLTRGRDLRWTFQSVKDGRPVDFPPGDLYFEVETDPVLKWPCTISGSTAVVKVEHEVTDQVPNRTKWQLVFMPEGETAGGDPVARGIVKVQGL